MTQLYNDLYQIYISLFLIRKWTMISFTILIEQWKHNQLF